MLLLINYMVMRYLVPGPGEPITIPYTVFKQEVAKGNVAAIYSRGNSIEGRFKTAVTWPAQGADKPVAEKSKLPQPAPRTADTFTTEFPAFVDPGLEAFLIGHNVEISAVPIREGSPWATLLFGFGPAILLIGFYVWLYRRAAQQGGGLGMGGLMGIGRSKARRYDETSGTKVTFDDVAGIDEAENELVEIVDFLRSPEKYTRLGGSAPKGVLLVGAPGTGKTLL
ncbi:MAG TPA: ATP-dependent metallopeptidase FtsH/Yme1/Tma family protein, partial [Burkholderiales bacterium]|nr:ATP-dependent metallopeptidase FtsH/Yme1/Tma family protein [Burkholderiales bacterium]